jgi:hypothetical protein
MECEILRTIGAYKALCRVSGSNDRHQVGKHHVIHGTPIVDGILTNFFCQEASASNDGLGISYPCSL